MPPRARSTPRRSPHRLRACARGPFEASSGRRRGGESEPCKRRRRRLPPQGQAGRAGPPHQEVQQWTRAAPLLGLVLVAELILAANLDWAWGRTASRSSRGWRCWRAVSRWSTTCAGAVRSFCRVRGLPLVAFEAVGVNVRVTEELSRVASGVAAVSGLSYSVALMTSNEYRADFFGELTQELEVVFRRPRAVSGACGSRSASREPNESPLPTRRRPQSRRHRSRRHRRSPHRRSRPNRSHRHRSRPRSRRHLRGSRVRGRRRASSR